LEIKNCSFRAKSSNLSRISEKFSFEQDFRFCKLSVWGVPLHASEKISCVLLFESLKIIQTVPDFWAAKSLTFCETFMRFYLFPANLRLKIDKKIRTKQCFNLLILEVQFNVHLWNMFVFDFT
jgi:hypothetical protein